jgi:branched-chain amino acid transport system ATP-binding protein
VIGPNGAGKTTLFNAISRLVSLRAGDIRIAGTSVRDRAIHEMVQIGVARTFQHLGVFPSLSVHENIALGGMGRRSGAILPDILALPAARAERRRLAERAREIADLCGLTPYIDRPAEGLPFGVQKRVEIARAVASSPKLLLLDEPAGGLNHRETEDFLATVLTLKETFRLTVVMIEHHLGLVMKACTHVVVLNFGRLIAEGRPEEVRANNDVIAAYIGRGR